MTSIGDPVASFLKYKLKEKIDILSGFADPDAQIHFLNQRLKFYDKSDCGKISFRSFITVMEIYNFVGMTRLLECVFNNFDENFTGQLDYKQFSRYVLNPNGCDFGPVFLSDSSLQTMDDIRYQIILHHGAGGLHEFEAKMVARQGGRVACGSDEPIGDVSAADICSVCRACGVEASEKDVHKMLRCFYSFDVMTNRVPARTFLRALKAGMSFERKQLVRVVFNLLDARKTGYVDISVVLKAFDPTSHPSVVNGNLTTEQCTQQMLAMFEATADGEGVVTWPMFLDFYRGISMALPDSTAFELAVRNGWQVDGITPPVRNTANCHRHMMSSDSSIASSSMGSPSASMGGGNMTSPPRQRRSSGSFGSSGGTTGLGSTDGSSVLRRVCVVHSTGKNEIVDVWDDFGIGKFQEDVVRERLMEMGVEDIKQIVLRA